MDDIQDKPFPKGIIVAVAGVVALAVLALWISSEKKKGRDHQAAVMAMDQELTADEEAIKTQRTLVDDLSKQVEELRAQIQSGEAKDGKAAVSKFNTLAAQQRAEREKFLKMAETFNQKVAKFRDLQDK